MEKFITGYNMDEYRIQTENELETITIEDIKKTISSLEFLLNCKITSIEIYGYFTKGYGREWYPIELTNSNNTLQFNCKYSEKKLWHRLKIDNEENRIDMVKIKFEKQ